MNRFKLIMIVLIMVLIVSMSEVYAIVNSYSLLGKTIYIDPGHGGVDGGTSYGKINEKDINLVMSRKIQKELVAMGANVLLTRDSDKDLATTKVNRKRSDLANRAYLINKSDSDMYISIHLNYIANSRWQGLQIFYNDKNKENEEIAKYMTEFLREKTSNIRDYKKDNGYYMYKRINNPGVLIELGFLSNANDRYRLTREEYQDKLARMVAEAIEGYFVSGKKD